jgi:hypothetical protein
MIYLHREKGFLHRGDPINKDGAKVQSTPELRSDPVELQLIQIIDEGSCDRSKPFVFYIIIPEGIS